MAARKRKPKGQPKSKRPVLTDPGDPRMRFVAQEGDWVKVEPAKPKRKA